MLSCLSEISLFSANSLLYATPTLYIFKYLRIFKLHMVKCTHLNCVMSHDKYIYSCNQLPNWDRGHFQCPKQAVFLPVSLCHLLQPVFSFQSKISCFPFSWTSCTTNDMVSSLPCYFRCLWFAIFQCWVIFYHMNRLVCFFQCWVIFH